MQSRTYLVGMAAVPVDEVAASEDAWANPSSQHQLGRAARARIEHVREQLAACVAIHPRDVLFAGSGTEANNLALRDAAALVASRLDRLRLLADELELLFTEEASEFLTKS